MAFNATFEDIALEQLRNCATELRDNGWRAMQVLCTNTESGVDITYSFNKGNDVRNYQLRGVTAQTTVPSIQDLFIGVFPFENEAKDLFGVDIEGMILDFAGEFYQTRMDEPMTILTPEAKERKDKEAKKAAAAAAKAAKDSSTNAQEQGSSDAVLTDEEIEAKVAGLPDEKAEKLRAALKAKQAKSAATKPSNEAPKAAAMTDEEIEAKVAGLPADKAEKLRAALKAKQAQALSSKEAE